jgi:protein tyrosine phosphatase (PTP) superfamily phosphohydrolase (DUF442 family)
VKTIGLNVLAFAFLAATCQAEVISDNRPSLSTNIFQIEGVPNFYKLSEDLYRSGQPTPKGLRNLMTIGIRTVVDLRWLHSDWNEIRGCGLEYEHIHMTVLYPGESQAVKFLQIVGNKERTPVLVHCQHGADRTGVMCAIYRIAVQGWTKEKALKEMIEGGFGFHGIWGNLIQWINKLDIDKIREKARITENVERGAFEIKHFGQSRAFFDFHTDSSNTISSGLF